MQLKRFSGWLIVPSFMAVSLMAAGPSARLVDAVKNTDKASARALVEQHVDVNAPETNGTTALHWAARWDDLETAELLIRNGANVKAANRYNVTPLSLACVNGAHIRSAEPFTYYVTGLQPSDRVAHGARIGRDAHERQYALPG